MTSAISNLEPATPTSPKDAKSGDAKSRTDESGVAGGITVLILAVPLLLISALAFYSGRLAQADNHLSWAATSAARAGANCRSSVTDVNTPGSDSNTPDTSRSCTFREAALSIEQTARVILLENRRLFCQNSNSTGMRVEYQDQDGTLIYAYVIGSLLLNSRYWPDRGGDISTVGSTGNPQSDPNFSPLQARNLRRDFNGNALFLRDSEGVIEAEIEDDPDTADNEATPAERGSNPPAFDAYMDAPLESSSPVSRITVHLICDFAGGATGLLARASTREASAIAVVPAVVSAEVT